MKEKIKNVFEWILAVLLVICMVLAFTSLVCGLVCMLILGICCFGYGHFGLGILILMSVIGYIIMIGDMTDGWW